MTPQQKVDHVYATIKHARQAQFTREIFVSMLNRLWDAVEGSERDASGVQLAFGATIINAERTE